MGWYLVCSPFRNNIHIFVMPESHHDYCCPSVVSPVIVETGFCSLFASCLTKKRHKQKKRSAALSSIHVLARLVPRWPPHTPPYQQKHGTLHICVRWSRRPIFQIAAASFALFLGSKTPSRIFLDRVAGFLFLVSDPSHQSRRSVVLIGLGP